MFKIHQILYGNTVLGWLIALGVAAGTSALLYLARRILQPRLAALAVRTATPLDDWLVALLGRTHFLFFLALGIALGAQFLELPPRPTRLVALLAPMAFLAQLAVWLQAAVDLWLGRRFQAELARGGAGAGSAAIMGFVLRVVLWSTVLLAALDLLGFNITALAASLGVGGIAVALAVQNILGDLFASLSIALDKPFVIGDFIVLDKDYLGTVEYIGLKTTRVRSLSGEQIILANGDLLKSRIRNFKKMLERRVVFGFALAYRTPVEQLERLPETLKAIVLAQARVRFDRAHFFAFQESGLVFEVVYYVLDPDYTLYMDIQQAINLAILRTFRQEGVAFSFPARTVLLAGTQSP